MISVRDCFHQETYPCEIVYYKIVLNMQTLFTAANYITGTHTSYDTMHERHMNQLSFVCHPVTMQEKRHSTDCCNCN